MLKNNDVVVDYKMSLKTNEKMEIALRIPNSFGYVKEVKVLFNRHGETPGTQECELKYDVSKSNNEASFFTGFFSFSTPGYRTFFIQLKINNVTKYVMYNENEDEAIITNTRNHAFWKLFIYYSSLQTPDWVKGGIMYQIFVDTFCYEKVKNNTKFKIVDWNQEPKWRPDSDGIYRNNQFYGGNLRGIINKLPYIKSLNVTVIYLTPIFKSPSSNRYDIVDFEEIDEMVGTWDDLKELHEKANTLGISLIVDLVFNHSSNENKLLEYDPDMYDWEQKYTVPKYWWGYSHLVEFNKNSENYFKHLASWLDRYQNFMDGIRLDVADNLSDFVLKYIRNHFSKYLLGEVWKNAIIGDYREFLYGDELDGVMNYQFANAIYRYLRWGNYKNFKRIINEVANLYPPDALAVSPIFISSHDIPRIPNILVGDFMKESDQFENVWDMEKDNYWFEHGSFNTYKFRSWEAEHEQIPTEKKILAEKLHKLAVFLQYTLPGIPSIFAGDEAGLTGFKDPFNRKPFPWNNINEKIYHFYCMMGNFRITRRATFSDSSNFKLEYIDEDKLVDNRGNIKFIINRSDERLYISDYISGKKINIFSILQFYNFFF